MSKLTLFTLLIIFTVLPVTAEPDSRRFYPDDPLWQDADNLTIPAPEEWTLSDYYDFVENTFLKVGTPDQPVPAMDVNTLGEVPDSSWYTNRHAFRRMSLAELTKGPNTGEGPDMSGPWRVIRGKSAGITPGFVIRDARDDMYFIKFDPMTNPEMATGAEIISTKFFYAIGYHVPENYLVRIDPSILTIDPQARYTDLWGNKKAITPEVLDDILRRVPHQADGRIRAVASKALDGRPVGPFKYYGTRADDANDIFPHEHRRVLRGLYVIAAWLNHDDSRSINSLDVFVAEGDSGYIRHHLMDFGSCLGSGSVRIQSLRAGWEYMVEWSAIFKGIATLGLWVRPYLKADYPDYPSIGRLEYERFDPAGWKPEYPNPAFQNMLLDDAFWGARQVMAFTDEEIAAVCRIGEYSDPAAEAWLVRCLRERRDKTGRHWLTRLQPVHDFAIEGDMLVFRNLGLAAGLPAENLSYGYAWYAFDNETGVVSSLDRRGQTADPAVALPEHLPENRTAGTVAKYFLVKIVAETSSQPLWRLPVSVYLRHDGGGWTVVGIERAGGDIFAR
ncbi:MAG: hypothetical protein JXQ27_10460 [Acidobacteria bacterium]|nr:hypothetical protein [Acidobacteriota bacterium]